MQIIPVALLSLAAIAIADSDAFHSPKYANCTALPLPSKNGTICHPAADKNNLCGFGRLNVIYFGRKELKQSCLNSRGKWIKKNSPSDCGVFLASPLNQCDFTVSSFHGPCGFDKEGAFTCGPTVTPEPWLGVTVRFSPPVYNYDFPYYDDDASNTPHEATLWKTNNEAIAHSKKNTTKKPKAQNPSSNITMEASSDVKLDSEDYESALGDETVGKRCCSHPRPHKPKKDRVLIWEPL